MDSPTDQLIDRLVAEGRATRQRGKYVVWVEDWGSLTHEEQAMIRMARLRYRPASNRVTPRTSRRMEAAKRARQAEINRKKRKKEKKYGHLVAPKIPFGLERWQKAAWSAAASEFRKPSFAWAQIAAVIGWLVGIVYGVVSASAGWGAVAGLGTWAVLSLVFGLAVYGPYRRRVDKRARELLVIFEESRKRSRRVSDLLRSQVLERDGHACVYCQAVDDLHIDHIHAHSRGGLTEIANLQVLCGPCNIRKGARSDEEARRRRMTE